MLTGELDEKGFCALFEVESLRRIFSGRIEMCHCAALSAQIYWALATKSNPLNPHPTNKKAPGSRRLLMLFVFDDYRKLNVREMLKP